MVPGAGIISHVEQERQLSAFPEITVWQSHCLMGITEENEATPLPATRA